MPRSTQGHHTPEMRDRTQLRVRRLTRAAVVSASGVSVLIGFVVAAEHPGSSGASPSRTSDKGTSSTSSSSTGGSVGSSSGASSTTEAPQTTTTTPQVTSGGTSR
jgi:hypothetical protein